MAVLGIHFCARAFSSCGKWRPLMEHIEHGLQRSAGVRSEILISMARSSGFI